MTKEHLLELIDTKNPSLDKIRSWVQVLPPSTNKIQPSISRPGDVHMHPIFHHPYVLLEQHDNYWICGLLTSEPECPEILEPCRSRFYTNNYFTKVLLTYTDPHGKFLSTYENPNHLRSILKKLRARLYPTKTP
jgi:hypothetical protein